MNTWRFMALLLVAALVCCTGNKFVGSGGSRSPANGNPTPTPQTSDGGPKIKPEEIKYETDQNPLDDDDSPILKPVLGPEESGADVHFLSKVVEPERKKNVWIVTVTGATTGNVYNLDLSNDAVAKSTSWKFACSGSCLGGARTYVTEGGFVFIKGGPQLFYVNPDSTTPNSTLSPAWVAPAHFNAMARGCVVSYKRDGKRYVGLGWGGAGITDDNAIHFTEFAMNNSPPYAIDYSTVSTWTDPTPGKSWGYSCFIDQRRLIYYSAWGTTSLVAFDLTAKKVVNVSDVTPNAGIGGTIGSEILNPVTFNEGKGSTTYAISGDNMGNLLVSGLNPSGPYGAYTHSFDAKSKSIWQVRTHFTGAAWAYDSIAVYPRKCFSSDSCPGPVIYKTPAAPLVGPVSALGDGAVIGITRGSGDVYLIRVKNPDDLSSGLDFKKIFTAVGDPYMYTDYTGATLYQKWTEMTFDFGSVQDYKPSDPIAVAMTWAAMPGTSDTMTDLTVEVRCYLDAGSKGNYEAYTPGKALTQLTIGVASCKKPFKFVDVKLTQQGDSNTIMDVGKIQLTTVQNKK